MAEAGIADGRSKEEVGISACGGGGRVVIRDDILLCLLIVNIDGNVSSVVQQPLCTGRFE